MAHKKRGCVACVCVGEGSAHGILLLNQSWKAEMCLMCHIVIEG